jgi:pyrroloquinoline quinone biosynthesis protein E
MNGWGRRYLTVNPSGQVLPCPTAGEIKGLDFENVREKNLQWIWRESESFNRFRGKDWMPEPCKSCPDQEVDFGGCRCQAALLTGDPSRTDPVCELSPDRGRILQTVERAQGQAPTDYQYRVNPSAPSTKDK